MTVKEAAALYRVTDETMLGWVRDGHFPCRISQAELHIARDALVGALRQAPRRPLRRYLSR
ncbi:MAG TPA: helix-turn-helix domain-containing protein [Roseiflexaceae bacterium]|nr:helix-turn-helix domain-containing protein [Roseiflexaceae bacterium]HMP40304.1 helix-turn-helix domain-containing protein [Roseiflexaceae bacterium]